MHQRVGELLRLGIKQSDVIAELTYIGTRGVDAYWGDYPACVPNLGAGADASAPHLTWTDRPIRADESVFFELAGVHKRYHCPLSRTYYLGRPTQQILDAEKAVLDGMQAGLERPWPVTSARISPEPIPERWRDTALRRRVAQVTRSGWAIRLRGARARRASGRVTRRN